MRTVLVFIFFITRGLAFEHFEARHLHPVELTPDGSRLLAVNSLEGRLSVLFPGDSANPEPILLAEIPVGLEPVTVRARTNTEAWVVNELSDSVSIVDLVHGTVIRTLHVPDEPADVVFAGDRAFVSCGRANRIAVYNAATFEWIAAIPLRGIFPRALAVSPDGTRLFAAFLLSGNNTTTLHFRDAPPQPAPTNPSLPDPPQVGLIVPDTDPRIPYDVLDHDVAEIDTGTMEVIRYHGGLGTNLFGLTVAPDGTLWSCASDARNLIRFESELNGIFAVSQIARVLSGEVAITDLNPHPVKAEALAQPMALLVDAERDSVWLAAFGSDRVAELDPAGDILRHIDLRGTTLPDTVRGPRGLAKSAALDRLYVLNKLSDTLSVIDLATHEVAAEVAISSHDPMPAAQRAGRGFFFDSRRSGNGTVSCGACHFDADNDGIAWDLGDPGGEMLVLAGTNLSLGETEPMDRPVHPMKGPMVTQSLRGIKDAGPFHWRGDKQSIQDFNSSFATLQAGAELQAAEMNQVAEYLESLRNHPNPNLNLDNSLRDEVAGGNPTTGGQHFHKLNVCSKCHDGPRGTNHVIDEFTSVLTRQPVKNSTLEHSYRKVFFTPDQPESLSGFGFTHDGSGHDLPRGHEYDQDRFSRIANAEADVLAFILSTETDTAPAVGASLTIRSGDDDPVAFRATMQSEAARGHCDLVLRGTSKGEPVSFLYHPGGGFYQTAAAGIGIAFVEILTSLTDEDTLTLLGVPHGTGERFSVDRDLDGLPDDESPRPVATLEISPLLLRWSTARTDWLPEHSPDLVHWQPFLTRPERLPASSTLTLSPDRGPFFRLRRIW